MNKYPGSQVLAMLKMYDALPRNAAVVDVTIIPSIKIEVECFLAKHRRMDPHAAHRFCDSLITQYLDMVCANYIFSIEKLECEVSSDGRKVTMSWRPIFFGGKRTVEFDVLDLTEAEIDQRLQRHHAQMNGLARIISEYNNSNGRNS